MISFKHSDGGRADAGYATRRDAGDCVVRAIALALHDGRPDGAAYKAAYKAVSGHQRIAGGRRSARDGVKRGAAEAALVAMGFRRVRLASKAEGGRWLTFTECWDRFRRNMVINTRGHMSALVNGTLMDTADGRTYEWEGDYGIIETRERKTATVWLAPVKASGNE